MAFKLPNIKGGMDRKYGTGDFARGGKKFEQRMKPGESKFNYDTRMRKQGRKATKPTSTYKTPDSKSEINIEGGNTPSYDYQMQERNPGDLREQERTTDIHLPSAPGDEWRYEWDQYGPELDKLRAWDKDGNLHNVDPGSKADKAIRKRYTGSETGDLSNWYGHDTRESTFQRDDAMGDEWDAGDSYIRKQSYLPYDLAQKKYNPKYKGSKK